MAIFTLIAFMLPLCVAAGIVEGLCVLADRRQAKREWKYIRERYYPEQQY
jgi:hypothetical protein